MLTREPRCPNDRARHSPDRHATPIVAAYIAGAARSSTLAGSPAWRPPPPGGQPDHRMTRRKTVTDRHRDPRTLPPERMPTQC